MINVFKPKDPELDPYGPPGPAMQAAIQTLTAGAPQPVAPLPTDQPSPADLSQLFQFESAGPQSLALPRLDPTSRQAPDRDVLAQRALALLTGLGAIGTAATGGRGRLGAIASGVARGGATGLQTQEAKYTEAQQGFEEWLDQVGQFNTETERREAEANFKAQESDRQSRISRQQDLSDRAADRVDENADFTRDAAENDRRTTRDADILAARDARNLEAALSKAGVDQETRLKVLQETYRLRGQESAADFQRELSDPLHLAQINAQNALAEQRGRPGKAPADPETLSDSDVQAMTEYLEQIDTLLRGNLEANDKAKLLEARMEIRRALGSRLPAPQRMDVRTTPLPDGFAGPPRSELVPASSSPSDLSSLSDADLLELLGK